MTALPMAVHLCFYPSLDISDINMSFFEMGYINILKF